MLAALACSLPGAAATSTPRAAATGTATSAGGGVGGGSNGTNNNDAGPTPRPTATRAATATPTPTVTPTATDTPTDTPAPTTVPQGPYLVKQTETLGGETLSGAVCSLTEPFIVTSTTPKVTFTFVFTPQAADHGTLTYAYSIPSAGETHDAHGTYTIQPAGADGTLTLSLSVSDHVTFKGFDGNIPLKYQFNLVPTAGVPCPSSN